MSSATATSTTPDSVWREAGAAWGRHASDWAYLMESFGRRAFDEVFARTGVGHGVTLLDVACGSGLALSRAQALGAEVAGIDAAAALIDIARARVPGADVRVGDMFALPYPDAHFDVVTSINGIWGGCEDAVSEVARVVRPGGRIGLTFWGSPKRLDLLGYFGALAATAPPAETSELVSLAEIGRPGVAEAMLERAGLEVETRGSVRSELEWPDLEIAWRALRSPGVAFASIEHSGEDVVRAEVVDALAPFHDPATGVRVSNELVFITARARAQR